jgi:hypothetical protein
VLLRRYSAPGTPTSSEQPSSGHLCGSPIVGLLDRGSVVGEAPSTLVRYKVLEAPLSRRRGNLELGFTGTLPAQYGLRTAGVLDITSRSFAMPSGEVSLYGGSRQTFTPSFDYGGSVGNSEYRRGERNGDTVEVASTARARAPFWPFVSPGQERARFTVS